MMMQSLMVKKRPEERRVSYGPLTANTPDGGGLTRLNGIKIQSLVTRIAQVTGNLLGRDSHDVLLPTKEQYISELEKV